VCFYRFSAEPEKSCSFLPLVKNIHEIFGSNTAWLLFRFQTDRDSFWSKEERGREIEKMQDHDEQAAADKIRTGESEELSESEKEEKVEKALARRHRGKTSDIYVAVVIVAVLVSVILFLERFIY
jgi:hypothetical protein